LQLIAGSHITASQPVCGAGQLGQHSPGLVMGISPAGQSGTAHKTSSQLMPPLPTLPANATVPATPVPLEPPLELEPPLPAELLEPDLLVLPPLFEEPESPPSSPLLKLEPPHDKARHSNAAPRK
jgi:hypothetical protein